MDFGLDSAGEFILWHGGCHIVTYYARFTKRRGDKSQLRLEGEDWACIGMRIHSTEMLNMSFADRAHSQNFAGVPSVAVVVVVGVVVAIAP